MKTYAEFRLLLEKEAHTPMQRDFPDQELLPSADEVPCNSCRDAEYNKLCKYANDCAAFQFHTLAKMPTMVHDFFSKGSE